jgi:hypothetical protein
MQHQRATFLLAAESWHQLLQTLNYSPFTCLYIWSMSSFKCSFHTNTKILNCHIIFRSHWNVVQSEMNHGFKFLGK